MTIARRRSRLSERLPLLLLQLLQLASGPSVSVVRHIRAPTCKADGSTPGDCFSIPAQ
jgi:hypothetical protein